MDDVAQSVLGSALGLTTLTMLLDRRHKSEAESQTLLWEETVRVADDLGPLPAFS